MGLAREYPFDASRKPSCWRLIKGDSALVWDAAQDMRWILRVIA